MSAPALNLYVTGQGSVSGDQLNTFEQTCDTLAQLRAFVGTTGMQVFSRGQNAPNDGGQGAFYWVSNAVGPDDNFTIIIPPGAASGGWVRITNATPGFFYATDTGTPNALAITLPAVLSALPIGTIIFVNPANTTTINFPTLSINSGTPVAITDPLGGGLANGAISQNNPAQIMVGTGHVLWLLNPGGSTLGPYATALLGQLPATATNDNAAAGDIGEFLTASGSAVGLTDGVAANIATLALTAGDWDVWGDILFSPAGTTTITNIVAAVSTISSTISSVPNPTVVSYQHIAGSLTTGGVQTLATGQIRVSIGSPASVYLVADSSFAASTMSASGFIAARRAR